MNKDDILLEKTLIVEKFLRQYYKWIAPIKRDIINNKIIIFWFVSEEAEAEKYELLTVIDNKNNIITYTGKKIYKYIDKLNKIENKI